MLIKDAMTRQVTAATPHTTACQIANKLLEGEYSGMPVIDENRKIMGVVTELDIIKAMQDGKDLDSLHADEIMTRNPKCVELNSPLEEAVEMMTKNGVIRLPVVHDGKLEGVISRCDVIEAYLKEKGHQPFVEFGYFMDRGT